MVTCATMTASAVYIHDASLKVRTRPRYVFTESPHLRYITPDLKTESLETLHSEQTRLAMETIFNRTPSRLDHLDRARLLFDDEAREHIYQTLLAPQAKTFLDNRFHQKVEIGEVIVNIHEGRGQATTVATGQLVRVGSNEQLTINETWSVKVFFTWRQNDNPKTRALFPTVCDSVNFFSMERVFP